MQLPHARVHAGPEESILTVRIASQCEVLCSLKSLNYKITLKSLQDCRC